MTHPLLPLSEGELIRALGTLRRRFARAGNPFGVVDVRFGTAYSGDGAMDRANRPFAVCFTVDRKYRRLPKTRTALPTSVEVRITRDGQRHVLTLPTDVIEDPTPVSSGRDVLTPRRSRPGGFDEATAGGVVGWKAVSGAFPGVQDRWAVLTVGHACDPIETLDGNPVSWVMSTAGRQFPSTLRAKAVPGSKIDGSLHLVGLADLQAEGFVPIPQQVMPFDALMNFHRKGQTLRPASYGPVVTFDVRTPPQPVNFDDLGPLNRIVEVKSSDPGAFQPGTSGSIWKIEDDAGVLQFACLQVGRNKGDSSVGYGQVLDDTLLKWVEDQASKATAPYAAIPATTRFFGSL